MSVSDLLSTFAVGTEKLPLTPKAPFLNQLFRICDIKKVISPLTQAEKKMNKNCTREIKLDPSTGSQLHESTSQMYAFLTGDNHEFSKMSAHIEADVDVGQLRPFDPNYDRMVHLFEAL